MQATVRNEFFKSHQLTHQRFKQENEDLRRMQRLRSNAKNIQQFVICRTHQNKLEVPLHTKMTQMMSWHKIKFVTIHCLAYLKTQVIKEVGDL